MHLHGVSEGPEGPTKIGDVGAWVDKRETHMWLLDMRLKRGGLRLYTAKYLRDPGRSPLLSRVVDDPHSAQIVSKKSKNPVHTRRDPTEQPVSQYSFLDQLLQNRPRRVCIFLTQKSTHRNSIIS
jgi:hypothetical protein